MVFLCLGKPNKNPDFDETFSNRELTTIFQTSEAIDWSSPFWKLVSVFCFIKTPLSLVGFILYCFFSVYITLLTLLLLIIHYVWFYVCVTCAHPSAYPICMSVPLSVFICLFTYSSIKVLYLKFYHLSCPLYLAWN